MYHNLQSNWSYLHAHKKKNQETIITVLVID